MIRKILVLFFSGKLANYAWFFGSMALSMAAITCMAWAYCKSDTKKHKGRALGEDSDNQDSESFSEVTQPFQ